MGWSEPSVDAPRFFPPMISAESVKQQLKAGPGVSSQGSFNFLPRCLKVGLSEEGEERCGGKQLGRERS